MTTPENSHIIGSDNILDIFITPDGILCTISDDNRKVILRRDLAIPINEKTNIATLEEFFNQPEMNVLSDNVNVFVENSIYQLIPSELFRENDIKTLFEITFGKNEDNILKYSVLPKWNMHLSFQITEKIADFFARLYPEIELKHIIFDLLKNFIKRTEEAVYLNIRKNAIDLALIADNKLQILNSFDVKTDEDICYFLLNIFEQFKLKTESFKLKIRKNNTTNQSTIELLKQYISVVEIVS